MTLAPGCPRALSGWRQAFGSTGEVGRFLRLMGRGLRWTGQAPERNALTPGPTSGDEPGRTVPRHLLQDRYRAKQPQNGGQTDHRHPQTGVGV